MLTRNTWTHAYGHDAGLPPPYHGCGAGHAGHAAALAQRGGLAGGVVQLSMPPGGSAGTGYGYLGMDPSDPQSWPRPFNPAPGMLSRPIERVQYELSGVR